MNHGHSHAPSTPTRAFAWAVGLNLAFVALELIFGLRAQSLALISDAGHNFSDVLGITLSWGAVVLSRRLPTARHTYGLRRSSILAALANAVTLLLAVGAIVWEAIRRLARPETVDAPIVMWVAAAGIVVNGVSAWMFAAGRKKDLNVRGAFSHLAADAAVSVGVVLSGAAILLTGWSLLDPVMSLVISAVIVAGTWGLLRESFNLAMDAVPTDIDPEAVRSFLASEEDVVAVHDLHIWAMSTTEAALTVHLVTSRPMIDDARTRVLSEQLHQRFGIEHVTMQWERTDGAHKCRQAPAETV